MVIKEGKVIAVGIFTVLFLAVANGVYFFARTGNSVGIMSGNSIKDVVGDFYRSSSINHRIFILFQFILLIVIVVIVLIIVKKVKSKSKLSKKDFVKGHRSRVGTDIDILYEMLKKDKEVSIFDVGRVFDVAPEVALEWAKVLENGNLARIEYPRFGKPVLMLFTKKINEEGEEIEEEDGEKKVEEGMEAGKEKGGLQKVKAKKVVLKKSSKRAAKKKVKKIDKKIKKVSKKVRKSVAKVEKVSKKIKKKAAKIKKKKGVLKKK